jgi:hypothetical protein
MHYCTLLHFVRHLYTAMPDLVDRYIQDLQPGLSRARHTAAAAMIAAVRRCPRPRIRHMARQRPLPLRSRHIHLVTIAAVMAAVARAAVRVCPRQYGGSLAGVARTQALTHG